MPVDNPLTLTRLLRDQLSRARMHGHASAGELEEAEEYCETIIQWLEEMNAESQTVQKRPNVNPIGNRKTP